MVQGRRRALFRQSDTATAIDMTIQTVLMFCAKVPSTRFKLYHLMTHADKILASLESRQSAARSRIAASWRRSFERHGLDPTVRRAPSVATESELTGRRARLDLLLSVAKPCLDQLYGLVGASGSTVVLTDKDGIILDQRINEGDARDFNEWGLQPGADWSEGTEGTNGIGTCLAEERAVIVHRDQHYFAKNIAMSCIGMPIHGATGELIGVLDVSSARHDQTDTLSNLIAAAVGETARKIETENFRASFSNDRVVMAGQASTDQSALVAINSDDCIIGATRAARKLFKWGCEGDLKPIAATDVFSQDEDIRGFGRGEKAAIVKAITRANGNVSGAAKALGISRATLYRRMKRVGLGRET